MQWDPCWTKAGEDIKMQMLCFEMILIDFFLEKFALRPLHNLRWPTCLWSIILDPVLQVHPFPKKPFDQEESIHRMTQVMFGVGHCFPIHAPQDLSFATGGKERTGVNIVIIDNEGRHFLESRWQGKYSMNMEMLLPLVHAHQAHIKTTAWTMGRKMVKERLRVIHVHVRQWVKAKWPDGQSHIPCQTLPPGSYTPRFQLCYTRKEDSNIYCEVSELSKWKRIHLIFLNITCCAHRNTNTHVAWK